MPAEYGSYVDVGSIPRVQRSPIDVTYSASVCVASTPVREAFFICAIQAAAASCVGCERFMVSRRPDSGSCQRTRAHHTVPRGARILSIHSGGTIQRQYAERLDSSAQDLQITWERPGDKDAVPIMGWLTAGLIHDAAPSQREARGR
jgi:hypothetical protein